MATQIETVSTHGSPTPYTYPPVGKHISTTYLCHQYPNISNRTRYNYHTTFLIRGYIEPLPASPTSSRFHDSTLPSPPNIGKTTSLPLVKMYNTPLDTPQHHSSTHNHAISHHKDNPNYPVHTPIILTVPIYNPHTPTEAQPCLYRDLTSVEPRQNINLPNHIRKTPRRIETKTFCKNIHKHKHLTPPTPASRNRHTP